MISIESVSKVFYIPHDKRQTIKDHFVNVFNKNKYNKLVALDNISFEIRKGEFIGVIGKNGSGKSTLLYIMAGIYPPTTGKVRVKGSVMPFLELGVGFNGELSARENIYLYGAVLGLTRKQIDAKFDEIIKFAELEKFVNTKLKNFSSGMQVRLAFATAIQVKADIYLVDEVLAVGDAGFSKKCFEVFEQLKKERKTIVFVSHDLESVKRFSDRVVWLENSKIAKIGKGEEVVEGYLAK